MTREKLLKLAIAAAAAAHLAILIAGMYLRFIDGDEGGMLVLSKEIVEYGRIPILDINAHNQPLLYYFYGLWMRVAGFSIVGGRSLSVAAIFASGALVVWWTRRFSRDLLVTLVVYLLFIVNLTYFKTNIPVKPFALSNLLTFAAFAVVTGAYMERRALSTRMLALSGLLLGISMGVRLVFLLPITFALWVAWVTLADGAGVRQAIKRLAVLTVATTAPMLPAVWIFIKEPLRAYTIWAGAYAQIYLGKGNNPDFIVDIHKGNKTAVMMKGLIEVIAVPDTVVLLVLIAASTAVYFIFHRGVADTQRRRVYVFIWLVFATIVYICSNLYGNYLGYVNQVVIFMVLLTVPLFEEIVKRVSAKKIVIGLSVVIILSVVALDVHYRRRLKTSIFYMLPSDDLIVTPALVDRLSRDIVEKVTKPDDVVLDNWGVFVFESGRRPVMGFEYPTDSAFFWELMTDMTKARKYGFVPKPELFRQIDNNEIPLLILGDGNELNKLLTGEPLPDDPNTLNNYAASRYELYAKYFVKPTNAWVIFYVPKNGGRKAIKETDGNGK
ncbi:MAG: hypothetical protein HZB85_04405 [Deltaproteobacteria bacterium]|nr:hypothetical protein [Deltaproteobacteria bacterium]